MATLPLKKSLGQHFLIDRDILERIMDTVRNLDKSNSIVVEVGPGMGALTEYLFPFWGSQLWLIEKDDRFVIELSKMFPSIASQIIHQDVLQVNWSQFKTTNIHIVGNFPYNISTQIVFSIIENFDKIELMTGMFQREVARRIASGHGSKEYGILSVLTQSLYRVQYQFDISPSCFDPPPKVVSGVITMERLPEPLAEYNKLKRLVKAAFGQRRKTLSNSLKGLEWNDKHMYDQIKHLRPEQIPLKDFFSLSHFLK